MPALLSDLGLTPTVTPSDFTRYFHSHNQPERFTTPSIAAYFRLTAREAQEAMNRYADDNLVAYAGEHDGVESWTTTYEGRRVLRYRETRWTKKSLAAVIAALSAEQFGSDVVEVSCAGRALDGAANGILVIGLRMEREPYSEAEHLKLMRRLLDLVREAGGTPGPVSILLFKTIVPYRLRNRKVISGVHVGTLIVTDDSQVDQGELASRAAIRELITSLEQKIERPRVVRDEWDFEEIIRSSYSLNPALHGLDYQFEYEWDCEAFPLDGRRSPLAYDFDTEQELRNALPTFQWVADYMRAKGEDFSDRWGTMNGQTLADVDYHLARGTLPTYISSLEKDVIRWLERYAGNSRNPAPALLAALYLQYEHMSAKREHSQSSKGRPPGPVDYYAAFDCLNGERPLLVGFIRQPLSHQACIDEVADIWYGFLKRNEETIGGALQKAGMDGVRLSLQYRLASDVEVSAFDRLSAQAGGTLRFVLMTGYARFARNRYSSTKIEGLPTELKNATWGDRPVSRIVLDSRWRSNQGLDLSGVIATLPEPLRGRAKARLIDISKVAMHDFVSSAADPLSADAVVLTSGFREGWGFTIDGSCWEASIAADTWSVKLRGKDNELGLELRADGQEFSAQLAPHKPRFAGSRHYRGRLSSVFPLMRYLLELQRDGVEIFTAKYGHGGLLVKNLDWYVDLINRILRGFSDFGSGDGTSWPRLRHSSEDEEEGETLH